MRRIVRSKRRFKKLKYCRLFGLAIGLASFFNILLPFAFRTRSDTFVAFIQIIQGLVQVIKPIAIFKKPKSLKKTTILILTVIIIIKE